MAMILRGYKGTSNPQQSPSWTKHHRSAGIHRHPLRWCLGVIRREPHRDPARGPGGVNVSGLRRERPLNHS